MRKTILPELRKQAPSFSGKEVLFCFTSDPYQHLETESNITRQAIEILHANNIRVTILTKGGSRSIKDFDLLKFGDKYGATLTFVNPEDSLKWEPNAALPEDRISALREAKKQGIETWASLEPVISP